MTSDALVSVETSSPTRICRRHAPRGVAYPSGSSARRLCSASTRCTSHPLTWRSTTGCRAQTRWRPLGHSRRNTRKYTPGAGCRSETISEPLDANSRPLDPQDMAVDVLPGQYRLRGEAPDGGDVRVVRPDAERVVPKWSQAPMWGSRTCPWGPRRCRSRVVTSSSAQRAACYAPGWTGVTFRKFGA
jgi:hypothetical protein